MSGDEGVSTAARARQWAADPRPARTRAAVEAALQRLAQSGQDVTVNSVVREAGVSRAAFYAQFSGLDDLAVAVVTRQLTTISRAGADARDRGVELREAARDTVRDLVRHIATYRAFFLSALDWKVSSRMQEAAAAQMASAIRRYLEELAATPGGAGSGVPQVSAHADTARFLAGGVLHMIIAWLREESSDSLEAFTDRVLAQLPVWMGGTDHSPT
ncbi:TetR/AcrR family transcriptional regulator [Streptomyces sp. UG1]|uniref:TetR/AcrR family transcriptional regulator n=1 Tax=Streptomyces sp. UG1 TaxID=3417652 RepID=UPI003CF1D8D8